MRYRSGLQSQHKRATHVTKPELLRKPRTLNCIYLAQKQNKNFLKNLFKN